MDHKPNHVWLKNDADLEVQELLIVARSMIVARKALHQSLPRELIHDPALDILLHLFLAYNEGKVYTETDIALVTTVHDGGAARWIKVLSGYGFVEIDNLTIELSDTGVKTIQQTLRDVSRSQWQFSEAVI